MQNQETTEKLASLNDKIVHELNLPDFKTQIITKYNHAYMELHKDHFIYSLDFTSEEPEDETIDEKYWVWKEKKTCFTTVVKRSTFIATEISRGVESWQVTIDIGSPNVVIKVHFKKKDEAVELHSLMTHYLLNLLLPQ